MTLKRKRLGLYLSPWMIIGTAVILLMVVLILAASNYNREKGYMADILLEKGAALIKAFEAGTRTGMMSMGWNDSQVQRLLSEIANLPDVLYLTITDTNGRILAASDPSHIGKPFSTLFNRPLPAPTPSPKWRLTTAESAVPAFEVYQYFNPFSAGDYRGSWAGNWCSGNVSGTFCTPGGHTPDDRIIFIGFDRKDFIEARHEDLRNTAIISAVLLLMGFAGFISMFVTQSYRDTRRRLQDTRAVSAEVISNLPVGLLVIDPEGRIYLENDAAASITGYRTEDIRGKPADQVLPENLRRILDLAQKDQQVIEKEIECRFGDSETISLNVSAASIHNEEGLFVGCLIILRDLTEIKALQQMVQRKEKLAAIGGLAAGIAHEIRNPLSSVKGMATFFKNRFADDPEASEAAIVMANETDRLNRVISELLEFARPSKINSKPSDINAVIDHSIRLIQSDAADRHIGVLVHKEAGLPEFDIDADRIIQCLLNLYLNAIQAMENNGTLTVTSRRAGDYGVDIEVADTGAGISEKHLNQIFDPYFTTKSTGTGLGLAIVHKIIENHGGQISVKSSAGEGTVFTIQLPESRVKHINEDNQ